MREHFLQNPGSYRAVLGACLLATLQKTLIWPITASTVRAHNLIGHIIMFYIMLSLFWGSILGFAAGSATAKFLQDERGVARSTLQRVGGMCSLLLGIYFGYRIADSPPAQEFTNLNGLKGIGTEFLLDLNLQAALLTFIAGLLLPRSSTDTVQVTENLRL